MPDAVTLTQQAMEMTSRAPRPVFDITTVGPPLAVLALVLCTIGVVALVMSIVMPPHPAWETESTEGMHADSEEISRMSRASLTWLRYSGDFSHDELDGLAELRRRVALGHVTEDVVLDPIEPTTTHRTTSRQTKPTG